MKYFIALLLKLGLSNYLANQLSKPNGFFGSRFIGIMMNRGNAQLEQLAVKLAEIEPNHHVLEIGFGNGKLLEQLCAIVPQGKVIGADISEDLVNQVGKKLRIQIKNGKLELHLAGVSNLPLPDASVDRIITCNTIYFWPNPAADAKELLRVLKPGGKLICGYRTAEEMKNFAFVTHNPDIFKNRYSDKEVESLLREAGFSEVEIQVEKGDTAESHVAVAVK